MNAADLARLDLAKRAFKAAQPGDSEVQTGVRRARLSLGRQKRRRSWFSKGLILVVLAVGSLAYAKPHGLAELVTQLRSREPASGGKHLASRAAPATSAPGLGDSRAGRAKPVDLRPVADVARATVPSSDGPGTTSEATSEPAAETTASAKTQPRTRKQAPVSARGSSAAAVLRVAAAAPRGDAPATEAVSDWGRVGQALARGDENEALVALNGLSKSDDPRTRDKADLGRAQLLLAHGNPDQACVLARSLTHRRAGGRIERQAQLLLKSCAR